MYRGVALVDWKTGLLAYVEADGKAVEEFRKILDLCGGRVEPRTLPCLSSLASRLGVKSVLYITDIYGIANLLAFERQTPRAGILKKAWAYLDRLICQNGEVECGEEVELSCCKPCGFVCLLAEVLGVARVGIKADIRRELRDKL